LAPKGVRIMLLQELNQYHASRVSNIIKQFTAASRNGNQDAIHELRVEIKRLRAFFELIKEIGVKFNSRKIFAPIRELFKSAALIRDAQVLQNLSREIISNAEIEINVSEYINILKQKEMNGITSFLKSSEEFNLSMLGKIQKMINNKLAKKSEVSIETRSKAYVDSLLDALNQFKIKTGLEENDFHNVRIMSKKTRYTLEIVASCYSKTKFELLNDHLMGIHQALGQWHDTDIALFFLKDILANQTLKPLFSESSYALFMKLLEERKEYYGQLFLDRFNLFDFKGCENSGEIEPVEEQAGELVEKAVEEDTGEAVSPLGEELLEKVVAPVAAELVEEVTSPIAEKMTTTGLSKRASKRKDK